MANPVCLAPLFRLVTVCQSNLADGDLEEVDALLGCPVFLPKAEAFDSMKDLSRSMKDVVCGSLFMTINWFREVINSFATMDSSEMKAKVTRPTNINWCGLSCEMGAQIKRIAQ